MAGVAHNLTISSPAGTLAEIADVSFSLSGQDNGYTFTFNEAAGSLTLVSYDKPTGSIGARGSVTISGTNLNESFPMAVVESVDTSATTTSAVTYTTTLRLVKIPSA